MKDKSKSNDKAVDRLARIAAMITNVDDNVARLMASLKKMKIADNTIVIFLVDNGPNSMRYVGKFRGMKTQIHEGGIRSPLWIHWPGTLKPRTVNSMSAHIDVMPTILSACNVDIPKDLKLDGRNLMPLLRGKKVAWPKRNIVIQTHRGDQPQKFHHFMICDGRWKLVHASGFHRQSFAGKPRLELYDLLTDPDESNNQFKKQAKIAARLKSDYEKWFDDVSSTRKNNYAAPRIIIGSQAELTTVLTRQDWRTGGQGGPNRGIWKVKVEKQTEYNLEVILPNGIAKGEISLICGDKVYSKKFNSAENKRIKLNAIELPAGNADLKWLDSNQAENLLDPYQLIIGQAE